MATRKIATQIDPITVIAIALKHVKLKADYTRIAAANTTDDLQEAWVTLSSEDQLRVQQICDGTAQPDLQTIASEIIACGSYLELQSVKSQYGEHLAKQAWHFIPASERQRIKALCTPEQQPVEQTPPMTEQPTTYPVEPAQPKTRSLFSISDDLEKLNELLDESGDDTQQQELINNWFEQLGDERDHKLDGYAALITEMLARAEVRKAESKRMAELATTDDNRARLLKDRLKWFFQTHNLKTVETARYKLSIAKNGGKAPLILDESIPVTQLPEQFQRVSVDANTTAIREALERGERLDFAQLGERGTSIRIK